MIDRYHLRYFLSVIDQGNFSKAAAACNVAQPTLSVGIAKLEKALGRTLFVRSNRRVELTDAGALLATQARRIEAGFADAERSVAGSAQAVTLRLGILVSTPPAWIEAFLRRHRASGRERIEIVEARERELHERLGRGRIDVALGIVRDGADRDDRELLFTEGYSLAMAADHPLAGQTVIQAEDLLNEPMIVRRHCEALSETSRHFTARGVRPFFAARTTSDTRALSCVRAGLGVTVMPDGFAAPGVVRPHLADFTATRAIGLLYAPHDAARLRASPTIRRLADTIVACHEGA